MENGTDGKEYLNLVETELLKQREVYLALRKGHRDSVCYKPYQDKKWGTQDANCIGRLRLVCYLLYEKEGDEETIAWLFEEELKDREQNSFQGIGMVLPILTFLLKKYNAENKYDDLFTRAKNANFDCACGYDTDLTMSETLTSNSLLDCIYLCYDLEYKTIMEPLVMQWRDSMEEWDDGKRAELIYFNAFLGKNKENEQLYLEQLNSAKQAGKLQDLIHQYNKIIQYYIEMGKIEIAHQYLDEARRCADDKIIQKTRLLEKLLEDAFEIVCLEQEEKEQSRTKTEELWAWAKQELKGVKSWYGNLYTKAIAAAKAMEDSYTAQLEKEYKAWQNTWKI